MGDTTEGGAGRRTDESWREILARGRLGLALSGGGFRAALFHFGVIAQMADRGLLRYVQVISTVSGGSIVGALYYLQLKELVTSKADARISDADYVEVVARVESRLLAGIRNNLIARTYCNLWKNLRMSGATYSRSDRIGELYDYYFYNTGPDKERRTQMRELPIAGFSPLAHDADRRARLPALLINAATLNTGHNWRFQPERMGEPDRHGDPKTKALVDEIDKTMRLEAPPSYDDLLERQQDIKVGEAVAASAAVPGMFPPLAISGLYKRTNKAGQTTTIRVQLVDGGVHDNQGIQGLLDLQCTHFVVSDASGQMPDVDDPATTFLPALNRASAVLQDRVREEQLFRLFSRGPVAFMHLRKGLPAEAIPWVESRGAPAPRGLVEQLRTRMTERRAQAAPARRERQPQTPESFGVNQEVQELLSRVRTSLDAFSEVEAYSLMLDGYRMSHRELEGLLSLAEGQLPEIPGARNGSWKFQQVADWAGAQQAAPGYLRQLRVASRMMTKVFYLSRQAVAVGAFMLALLGVIAFLARVHVYVGALLSRSFTLGELLLIAVPAILVAIVPSLNQPVGLSAWSLKFLLLGARWLLEPFMRFALRSVPAVLLWPIAWIQIWIFDRMFLAQGEVRKLAAHRPASG